ncbi:Cytochrome b6-f complex iron-sulfur subunit [Baekduia alba]|uniref:QcrA and Rieske domain-containing protein n=1 Tax=Baekduia alba TaxID=2997333 RepID=UPI0023427DC0|nr:Rieske 2Fe-2S domain-containing protein [Baekduia alba]WCB97063.1 Cytochrome b6-f complex iron-sulfur subunit [Baekduia alba]
MPKKQAKSKYTADRGIPGAFEGETVTRRRFMVGTAHATGMIATSAILLPALGFALGPLFEEHKVRWQPVGKPDEFPDDTYVPKVITYADGIGEAGKTTVYIRKRNAQLDTDKLPKGFESEQFVAISTRCMHLGCPVRYTEAAQRFICPCHGGVYDFQGKVDGGPPVRPLDRFYNRVRNGQVEIGPRFSVNRELKRFSPRNPGEPLDGIGGILYPSRPTIRKLDSLPQD